MQKGFERVTGSPLSWSSRKSWPGSLHYLKPKQILNFIYLFQSRGLWWQKPPLGSSPQRGEFVFKKCNLGRDHYYKGLLRVEINVNINQGEIFLALKLRWRWKISELVFRSCIFHDKIIYEDKVKSSWPYLRESRNKRPLGRDPVRSWSLPHYEYDKAFLVAAHDSMGIGSNIREIFSV